MFSCNTISERSNLQNKNRLQVTYEYSLSYYELSPYKNGLKKGSSVMGIINSNKELNVTRVDCNGNFQVRLALTAAPDILTDPTDIVLVLVPEL